MLSCKRSLTYTFLYNLLQKNHLIFVGPKQSAEWVVKRAVQDMNDYYVALVEYSANPSRFTGKPPQVTKRKMAYCRCIKSGIIKVDNKGRVFSV